MSWVLQDYFVEHLFEDCARQFREDRMPPNAASAYPHIGLGRSRDQVPMSPYTDAIIVTCNTCIQEALTADLFLSLNPRTKIKILAVKSRRGNRNAEAFERISKCLERHQLDEGQLELSDGADDETDHQLKERVQELCRRCWEENDAAEIVFNMTSGENRHQSSLIVLMASVHGCELVYTDMEPRAWESAIGAPNPRKQFIRVLPNQLGETFGLVGLHLARDMFTAKSFLLARCTHRNCRFL